MPENIRDVLIRVSMQLFSSKGYHGTTIREIADEAKVSLPTVYYYFKNKEDLFEKVVTEEFFLLHKRMQKQIDLSDKPYEIYANAVIRAKSLNDYDKRVLAMAMRVGFGFDGESGARDKILEWDKRRWEENHGVLSGIVGDKPDRDFVSLLIDVSEHLMERIILMKEDIADEEIRNRFKLLFSLVK